ncbi:hypothetical protein V1512DRAFT_258945 [Lipomyces arxii]|uniref:uncharacterized protein n=1 Tax=Lipomyces arxii TaxID=56418 RepID=UPI0034CD4DB5
MAVKKRKGEETKVAEQEVMDEIESEQSEESDGQEDHEDPFSYHFANPDMDLIKKMIEAAQTEGWKSEKPIKDEKFSVSIQRPGGMKLHDKLSLNGLKIKNRLITPFSALNKKYAAESGYSALQHSVAVPMFSGQDLLYTSRTPKNGRELQNMYTLHALNHLFKTRDTILKDNAKLARQPDDSLELRDQGFTRAKVLVILPTRQAAHDFIETVISLAGTTQQENLKRFKNEYYSSAKLANTKADDFRSLFDGNNDDNFRIGVKLTRKTVKLFTEFYSSDLIVASPLGLRLAIGDKTDKKRDFDYLSSVEVVIVDQAAALAMQNWDHVTQIFSHLNLIPTESHGCDFSRIRNWYLDSEAKYLRQTLVFAEFNTPSINALFSHHMNNVAGKVKFHPTYSGVLTDIGGRMPHVFMRIHAPTPQDDPDRRFKYFVAKALPSLMRTTSASSAGVLIFIPSYVDYVRVRNYLEQEHMVNKKLGATGFAFSAANEYTSVSELTRARAQFKAGQTKIFLYTERLHHFRRYEIRGAETVFMYGLPDNPTYYAEICRFLLRSVSEGKAEKGTVSVKSMFSKWDALKLERVVGSGKVAKMCAGTGDVYEFS